MFLCRNQEIIYLATLLPRAWSPVVPLNLLYYKLHFQVVIYIAPDKRRYPHIIFISLQKPMLWYSLEVPQ